MLRRLPELKSVDGFEQSLLDVFQRSWVVLSMDAGWEAAAREAAGRTGVEVSFMHVGGDVEPLVPGEFGAAYGLGSDGAALVRPDGYLAWRSRAAPDAPGEALTEALRDVAAAVAGPRSAFVAG